MKPIYDSLKSLVNQEMIKKAAETVDESQEKVSVASHSIISGVLAMMLKKGVSPQMHEILEEAGNLEILSDIGNICQEKPTKDQLRIGDNFLQHLLGDDAADFSEPIAEDAKISNVATNRLIAMIAPVIAGFFGNRMVKDNWSLHKVLEEIGSQNDGFKNAIPQKLTQKFDLNSVLNAASKANKPAEQKKNKSWMWWLAIILLILFFILFWKTCRNDKTEIYSEEIVVIEQISSANNNEKTTTDLKLPNGTIIKVNKGGVEEQMVNFLQSDKYKNASENDLKDKWFEFDNVDFEFNSNSVLESGEEQVDNIAAILKSFKDAKIKVGAFADKLGSDEVNLKISEDRAKRIEDMLELRGVGSQVVKIEGYGNEYAKVSANALEEARAKDRDIAIRFVK